MPNLEVSTETYLTLTPTERAKINAFLIGPPKHSPIPVTWDCGDDGDDWDAILEETGGW